MLSLTLGSRLALLAFSLTLVSLLLRVEAVPVATASVANEMVQCHAQSGCADSGKAMTVEQCCIDSLAVQYYTTSLGCRQCIVFGWLERSVDMVERYQPYRLEVGYIKGTGPDLTFNVVVEQGTTQHKADYTVSPQVVHVFGGTSPAVVEVDTFLDGVALEEDEHFTLKLELLGTPPVNGLFRDSLAVTLTDTDVLKVSLTSDSYRASESDGTMTVVVTKNKRIASPLRLTVSPLSIAQAITHSELSLPCIPPIDNRNSPNRAKSYPPNERDFDTRAISVQFLPDQDSPVNDLPVYIRIIDDRINEAPEEYFIVRLDKAQGVSKLVNLMEPQASLCKIVDDDPIRIGFTQPSYTITRPTYERDYDNVALIATEDNMISEQTFHMVVEAVAASPSPSIGVVNDYVLHNLLHFNQRIVVKTMQSGARQIDTLFFLSPDELPNNTVAFELVVSSENHPYFLPANKLHQSAYVIIEPASTQCQDGDVRLVGGIKATEGRVEVCYSNQWGSVCDDAWDKNNAMVVCKQLGLPSAGAVAHGNAKFGSGSGRILLGTLDCRGTENRLSDCSRVIGSRTCDHTEDAGVSCQ